MEILEKYEKLWNLDGKVIPDFELTGPTETILFSDIHWNITKYLGKINGILNKKLRKLWIQNDGFCVNYELFKTTKNVDVSNITEIYIDSVSEVNICLIAGCVRIERIFISQVGKFFDDRIYVTKILDYFVHKKFSKFIGIFIHNKAMIFQNFYLSLNTEIRIENYIHYLSDISCKTDYLFVYTDIPNGKILTSIVQYEKYYNVIKDTSVERKKYKNLRQFTNICPNIKVLITDDSRALQYYTNVLEPAYRENKIELELVIIGELKKTCYNQYIDLDGDVHYDTFEFE